MKLESILSRLATFGVVIATTGLALDSLALWFFSASATLFLVLIATGDYSHRPSYTAAFAIGSRRPEAMPLAA